MDVWDGVNDTLAILVWPLVVGGSLYFFRRQVSALLSRLRWGKLGNAEIEFDPAQADRKVEAASQALTVGIADDVRALLPPDDATARRAVYDIVKNAAKAGWDVAMSGRYTSPPSPKIEWATDSTPKITDWQGELAERPRKPVVTGVEADAVFRLEAEIKSLKLGIETLATSLDVIGRRGEREANERLIKDLQANLREIDPWSPYAW